MFRVLIVAFFVIGCLKLCSQALANGGDFFEELALHGLQENPNMGSPYFGFIRDERGKGINRAQISFTYGNSTKTATTNILGHYTQDGFDKTIASEDVEITCSKEGYEFVRVDRRVMIDRTLQPVEANCILKGA